MSFTKLFVHSVFSVKKRRPVLVKPAREHFFQHIRTYTGESGIRLLRINGHDDHVHALVELRADQSVASVMQSIKGESAYWANSQRLFNETLIWSRGYYARSIDPDNLQIVQHYIEGQNRHLPYFDFVKAFLASCGQLT